MRVIDCNYFIDFIAEFDGIYTVCWEQTKTTSIASESLDFVSLTHQFQFRYDKLRGQTAR